MFDKILIANRGEIACRIIRSARAMGVHTVAVFSEADRHALHVELADEAVYIGASAASDSYLRGERIIEAATRTGAQAIHPGYGFLSENADFAAACEAADIVFIGPPAAAIAAMGSKATAKSLMEDAGVPLVPGYHGDDQDLGLLQREAERIGYPVLLKAVAGGGGKGMRPVFEPAAFVETAEAAKREARSAFGDDQLLVERYIQQPRHVEVQVFFDGHGNGVYLFERDCSVQRRHQKIIEEAPAPGLSEDLRQQLGEAAVAAARAIDYVGAGTVEFLLDSDRFYFMEMNTRLQVEHPVTEMITGQDLVAWQLRVAAGEMLPKTQDQLSINGHAFEARIYAEDPQRDFMPATGHLHYLVEPAQNEHVRIDTGVRGGDDILPYYDPMIAKLVVWGENRQQALSRLRQALRQYRIAGVTTNIPFLAQLAAHAAFRAADISTHFIEQHREQLFPAAPELPDEQVALAALAYSCLRERSARQRADRYESQSPWAGLVGWRLNSAVAYRVRLRIADTEQEVALEHRDDGWLLHIGDQTLHASATLQGEQFSAEVEGHRQQFTLIADGHRVTLFGQGAPLAFEWVQPDLGQQGEEAQGGLVAPMNGTVVKWLAQPGQRVAKGDALLVMEAMKMEHTIRAADDGVVAHFPHAEGELVSEGAVLVVVESADDSKGEGANGTAD